MMRITKKQFEYFLYQYKLEGILFSYKLVDIPDIYEYVYEIRIDGCYDSFLLYSSIDKSTNETRDYATDRIRLVKMVKDGNRTKYVRICRFNRTSGLFDRMRNGLSEL